MRIHLVGLSSRGMVQLALLLRAADHDVSGADDAFDSSMKPLMEGEGIRCLEGYVREHVFNALDRVVVGDAIADDNPEVLRANELGLDRRSMSSVLRQEFLQGRQALVVAQTGEKTMTSLLCAWILTSAGRDPGFCLGASARRKFPSGVQVGKTKRTLTSRALVPFVVEADACDSVSREHTSTLLDYVGVSDRDVVVLTSFPGHHAPIDVCDARLDALLQAIPAQGLLLCDARDQAAWRWVSERARCRVIRYGLDGDLAGEPIEWQAAPAPTEDGRSQWDVYAGGSYCGRYTMSLDGTLDGALDGLHNVRSAVAAIAACAEGFGVGVEDARRALRLF